MQKGVPFAIFGGAVRDAFLASAWNKERPAVSDIDIVLGKKLGFDYFAGLPGVRHCFYNSFGGYKVTMQCGKIIEIFSEPASNFRKFIEKINLNCNQIAFTYPNPALAKTGNFSEFAENKTITISCASGYRQGPGGIEMAALTTAQKLSERFGMPIGLDDKIEDFLAAMTHKDRKLFNDYVNKKIENGNFFSRLKSNYLQ